MCLRICTGFKGVSFREAHLWEHFGRTDQIALITCLKKVKRIRCVSEGGGVPILFLWARGFFSDSRSFFSRIRVVPARKRKILRGGPSRGPTRGATRGVEVRLRLLCASPSNFLQRFRVAMRPMPAEVRCEILLVTLDLEIWRGHPSYPAQDLSDYFLPWKMLWVFHSWQRSFQSWERPALLNGPEPPGIKSHSKETPKEGFGEFRESSSKVTPKVGFPVWRSTGNVLSGLLLSYFPGIPKTFFRGFFRVRFNSRGFRAV